MGTTKNIEMREYNRSDYNLLLPKTDSYTKEKTLSSYTKTLLKLSSSAVPDDAFLALFLGANAYAYRVRVQLSDGTPVSGSTISGLSAVTGQTLTTGDDGIVLGKSTSASVTINCTSPYIDQKAPASQSVTSTGKITDVTLTLIRISEEIEITSSKTITFSPNVFTYDLCAVGGGAGGLYIDMAYGHCGAGGGGGAVVNLLGVSALMHRTIAVSIGSGGKKVSESTAGPLDGTYTGTDGGNTTINSQADGSLLLSAVGGKGGTIIASSSDTNHLRGVGGTGNGTGGVTQKYTSYSERSAYYVASGTNATGYKFNDSSLGIAGGGGGSVSVGTYNDSEVFNRPSKGEPNGGWAGLYRLIYNGNEYIRTLIAAAQDAGIGGGGQVTEGVDNDGHSFNGTGAGGNGKVYIRCNFVA